MERNFWRKQGNCCKEKERLAARFQALRGSREQESTLLRASHGLAGPICAWSCGE